MSFSLGRAHRPASSFQFVIFFWLARSLATERLSYPGLWSAHLADLTGADPYKTFYRPCAGETVRPTCREHLGLHRPPRQSPWLTYECKAPYVSPPDQLSEVATPETACGPMSPGWISTALLLTPPGQDRRSPLLPLLPVFSGSTPSAGWTPHTHVSIYTCVRPPWYSVYVSEIPVTPVTWVTYTLASFRSRYHVLTSYAFDGGRQGGSGSRG